MRYVVVSSFPTERGTHYTVHGEYQTLASANERITELPNVETQVVIKKNNWYWDLEGNRLD